mmetsp:Transcript_167124/g.536770  ORF Transcript_167124/g.536770 Transcript_167124/m.536770 type:complete len:217 (+) Transcript_167124:1434-2084(+)
MTSSASASRRSCARVPMSSLPRKPRALSLKPPMCFISTPRTLFALVIFGPTWCTVRFARSCRKCSRSIFLSASFFEAAGSGSAKGTSAEADASTASGGASRLAGSISRALLSSPLSDLAANFCAMPQAAKPSTARTSTATTPYTKYVVVPSPVRNPRSAWLWAWSSTWSRFVKGCAPRNGTATAPAKLAPWPAKSASPRHSFILTRPPRHSGGEMS